MLEVAKVLKLTFFSVRSLKSLIHAFSQIFPVTPIFFKILTTGTKGSIVPKSEEVPDVRDQKARSSLTYTVASPDPNPNECNSTLTRGTNNIYPYPYIDVNDRGHRLRITHTPRRVDHQNAIW